LCCPLERIRETSSPDDTLEKQNMRRLWIMAVAAGVSIGAAASASAGNIEQTITEPPPPTAGPYWTGFYLGGFGGGAWRNGTVFSSLTLYDHTLPHSWSASGGGSSLGGATMGFNWQIGSLLLGVETEIAYLAYEKNAVDLLETVRPFYGSITFNDWEEFIGGRVGALWGDALIYGKLGLVYGEYQARMYDARQPGPPVAAGDTTNFTMAAGGGVEYALTRHWSAKLEYLYMDFGGSQLANGRNYDLFGLPFPTNDLWSADPGPVQTVRFGVNYRFVGWRDESPFP
jgi:outer membrane immunogenic protein